MRPFGFIFILFIVAQAFGQEARESWLKPSDTLHTTRVKKVAFTQGGVWLAATASFHQLWYKNDETVPFRFTNDNSHWLQMDKAGHFYSTYHLTRFGAEAMQWAGANLKSQLIYGAGMGLLLMTTIEVADGFSENYGFSWGDMGANIFGASLYVGQELLWNEQRIVPKFSFQTTPYASARPEILGSSVAKQLFMDYNGQTYWLSANLHAFLKWDAVPSWLNIAFGYGATGMLAAEDRLTNNIFMPDASRTRQFYLSLDLDLTKIQTQNHTLKTLFSWVQLIKIPAPTLSFTRDNKPKFYPIFF